MQPKTLKFKVVLYLTVALSAAMLMFTGMVAWYLSTEVIGTVSDELIQVSEVVSRSTRFAMLQNQPAYVDRIIHDVANRGKIVRVRILSNDGKIVFSTRAPEVGQTDGENANNHNPIAFEQFPPSGRRTWMFENPDGQSFLGSMEVIRNEPSCYNAACHHHSKETPVLGVLAIDYSLD